MTANNITLHGSPWCKAPLLEYPHKDRVQAQETARMQHLQVAQGILDDLVPQASDNVHIKQVVKAALAGGYQVRADCGRHAAPHGARLNLGQVNIAQRKDAHGLEELPWAWHLMQTHPLVGAIALRCTLLPDLLGVFGSMAK